MMRNDILDKAKEIINGDRQEDYGDAIDSFSSIAAVWTWYLNHPVTAHDVSMLMALLKISRIKTGEKLKADSAIDLAGYAALSLEMVNYPNMGEFEEDG